MKQWSHTLRSAVAGSLAITALYLPAVAPAQSKKAAGIWLTTPDRANLLARKPVLRWKKADVIASDAIVVDDTKRFQTMDGFGHALTGGSAQLLMKMSAAKRSALLHELFDAKGGIGTSYVRVSIGASDMNDHVYTYDDMPAGQTDAELQHFSVAEDEKDVIPVLREILVIQPHLHIVASPWTAPAWMKDNGAVKGGSLQPQFYEVYAHYLVDYVQAMQRHGITINAITPQNEPENPKNTPSMIVTSAEEAEFIGKHLGPAIARSGLRTKIIDFDHNCDHPEYGIDLLKDPEAYRYTDGTGFHLYLGTVDAMSQVHDAFPNKNLYFTEQMVIPKRGHPELAIAEPVARLIIGAPENWSRNVLLWNLAADPQNGPHTSDGGCPICVGAMTLDGDTVTRHEAYYTAAHASEFVPPGSVRVSSASPGTLPHVAFVTPSGNRVLIVSNTTADEAHFAIRNCGKQAQTTLPAGAVATYVW
ncbi:glycoside hydrolase family 30 protein [Terriglobus aquaticus]|uniref:Glycoside hydrolase family 30 protein n=1 Tax=Terriglobus aquaticus TaxID=940139 RepID=A0ABW9KKJ8_9BACT|nr:glycoside hydrolase family 30 beta sandwich domain-containing protein [Terriglobus aquaticus]